MLVLDYRAMTSAGQVTLIQNKNQSILHTVDQQFLKPYRLFILQVF